MRPEHDAATLQSGERIVPRGAASAFLFVGLLAAALHLGPSLRLRSALTLVGEMDKDRLVDDGSLTSHSKTRSAGPARPSPSVLLIVLCRCHFCLAPRVFLVTLPDENDAVVRAGHCALDENEIVFLVDEDDFEVSRRRVHAANRPGSRLPLRIRAGVVFCPPIRARGRFCTRGFPDRAGNCAS